MLEKLRDFFNSKNVLILGFGLEGRSSARLLEKLNVCKSITVSDKTEALSPYQKFSGENYLEALNDDSFDIIMKTPGIALFDKVSENVKPKITGQCDLFLRFCENKTVGVTGTKGKSTASSLIHHILSERGKSSRLIGNIGVPPFDVIETLSEDNIIIMELSCHQLEYVQASPNIAILLNIYEEHLDHYIDFEHYKKAKENIFKFQKDGDILIRGEDEDLKSIIPLFDLTKTKLRGKHNLNNMALAVKVAELLGVNRTEAVKSAENFAGLEHRLELFAEVNGVKWVNDSISTIPNALIAAVEAFPETDTVIIGGMDRGIDYKALIDFLNASNLNIILLPDSGHKIAEKLTVSKVFKVNNMREAVVKAHEVTKSCCVLSPAAASYGFYKNFEERGKDFKNLVNEINKNS